MKFLFLVCALFISCKSNQLKHYNKHSVQLNSIDIFIHTNLFKKQNVFSVDTLSVGYDLIYTGIGKDNNKFLVNLEKDRYKRGKLPMCLEVNESLFFWYDDDHIATDDEIALLKKYNILFDDIPENLIYWDMPLDEKQKGLHIYYCKNNFNIYKKVKSNIAVGYYDPPKINCYK